MLLSGIMLKWIVIRWQLPIAPSSENLFTYTFRIGYCWRFTVDSSFKTKRFEKLLAYSSLAHVGLIAAGAYTLRLMVCVVLFCK
jgi:NADH-quinone oxidoreductase subunit M